MCQTFIIDNREIYTCRELRAILPPADVDPLSGHLYDDIDGTEAWYKEDNQCLCDVDPHKVAKTLGLNCTEDKALWEVTFTLKSTP